MQDRFYLTIVQMEDGTFLVSGGTGQNLTAGESDYIARFVKNKMEKAENEIEKIINNCRQP